jgi:hypothetical protein
VNVGTEIDGIDGVLIWLTNKMENQRMGNL